MVYIPPYIPRTVCASSCDPGPYNVVIVTQSQQSQEFLIIYWLTVRLVLTVNEVNDEWWGKRGKHREIVQVPT